MIEAIAKDRRRILVAGHRGCKAIYPENTLLSFQEAIDLGVDMLEFDLNLTKDKVVVVMHDTSVDRTTDGTGFIRDMTLEQIKALDAGGRFDKRFEGLKVPTLREFCDLVTPYSELLLNVEIKEETHETVDRSIELLREYELMPRCVFTCFNAETLGYMYDAYGVKTQGFPKEKMRNFVDGPNGTYSKMYAAGIELGLVTPQLVKELEEMGIEPWSYCPDTDEAVEKSRQCDIRLMTCNDPRPAIRILRENGQFRS